MTTIRYLALDRRRVGDGILRRTRYIPIRYIKLAAKRGVRARAYTRAHVRAALALPSRDRAVIYDSLCGN